MEWRLLKTMQDELAGADSLFNITYIRSCPSVRAMDVLPSRVFMNGNSQAERIPAEFRLATDRVQISRTPEGDLLIHLCPHQRGKALLDLLAGFDADFVAALD